MLILVQRLSDRIRFPAERQELTAVRHVQNMPGVNTASYKKMDISSEGAKKPEPVAEHSYNEYRVLLALLSIFTCRARRSIAEHI